MICYADKLTCDRVYEGIKSIIAASRKIAGLKVETRQQIDEFETKVEECRNKGIEDNADEADLQRQVGLTPPKVGPKPPRKTPGLGRGSNRAPNSSRKTPANVRRRVIEEDSDDDLDNGRDRGRSGQKRTLNGIREQPAPVPTRRSARERKKAQVQKIFEDSEDDSD